MLNEQEQRDRLQNKINTDDDFYKVYMNCIKKIAKHELDPYNNETSLQSEAAYEKLKSLFRENKLSWNKILRKFILEDAIAYNNNRYNDDVA